MGTSMIHMPHMRFFASSFIHVLIFRLLEFRSMVQALLAHAADTSRITSHPVATLSGCTTISLAWGFGLGEVEPSL